jgi:hypothetical protein
MIHTSSALCLGPLAAAAAYDILREVTGKDRGARAKLSKVRQGDHNYHTMDHKKVLT